jgi:hypothetical protein
MLVAMILAVLAAAVSLAIIAGAPLAPRQAFDQDLFHLKAIARFSTELPTPDFRDYESATTPAYHVLLAIAHRTITAEVTPLRLINVAWAIALMAVLGRVVGGRCPPEMALAVCLPVGCSMYILSSATALLPDNAAWLLVTLMLSLSLSGRIGPRTLAAGMLTLAALVLTRQIHLWTAAPLWAAAWLAWSPTTADERAERLASGGPQPLLTLRRAGLWPREGESRAAAWRLGLALLTTMPAVALLAMFVRLWGGLTPPAFQPGSGSPLYTPDATAVSGINPATPAFTLAILGIAGVFFLPLLLGRTHASLDRAAWRAMLIPAGLGAAIAFVLAILPETSYQFPQRISGLWNLVKATPTLAERSPALITLATLGGAWAGAWWGALPRRDAWIFTAAFAGMIAAHTASALAWQRYLEPGVLIMLALATSRLPMNHHASRWVLVGPLALAALLAAVSIVSWN